MLKKIVQDMYIEPQLLAELDEEQKQMLFCKMREEQIRRWKEWEAKNSEDKLRSYFRPSKPGRFQGKGKVSFMNGADGKPWTWVMGEHPDDTSIEEILEAEAHLKANHLAKQEALQIHFQGMKLTNSTGSAPVLILKKESNSARLNTPVATKPTPNLELLRPKPAIKPTANENSDLQKLEQRLSNEIYMSLKRERDLNKEKAVEESKQIEQAWLEQEKVSKKLEQERRSLAKNAREVWSNSLSRVRTESQLIDGLANEGKFISVTLPLPRTARGGNYKNLGKDRPEMPSSREAIIQWFQDVEEGKGAGLDPLTGCIATWFHGIISREETEDLLKQEPVGSFLIRVSDKFWGYVISYKSEARCKHFVIDAGESGYQFFGLYHVAHSSLADLIEFHKVNPLCVNSQDFLKHPVGQSKATPDYEGLFKTIPEESEDSYL